MADPYIGEIRIFAGTYAPDGWAECFGQLLAIAGNETLFTLLGTTFGGDGQSTFAMPDLRGRVPVHAGPGYVQGQTAGVESVTLTSQQLPAHSHPFTATTSAGAVASPSGATLASPTDAKIYRTAAASAQTAADSISPAGGNQPHSNIQPSLGVRYIIALYGIYPPQP